MASEPSLAELIAVRLSGTLTRVGAPVLGLRKYGVPPGGAFDQESQMLANALVGRSPLSECFELYGTAEFEASQALSVGVVGAAVNGSVLLSEGRRLEVSASRIAARTYISVGARARERRLASPPRTLESLPIRTLAGPQAAILPSLERGFSVSPVSDRMGLRLNESVGAHQLELPSEPACFGAVQVTNAGVPIILGPDGPTIGGYPKAAVVIDADLSRIGQLLPAMEIRLKTVSWQEANDASQERRRRIERTLAELALA